MRARTGVVAVAAAAVIAGCGTTAGSVLTPPAGAPPAGAPARPPAALPAQAVPYLPSSLKPLTARGLARETQSPALVSRLAGWGYIAGADRYFQGESRRLQVVDSRTLRFRSAAGASAFVAFMRTHTYGYLGSFAQVRGLDSRGRHGILAVGQPCQCHLANPAYLGLVQRGGTVSWLLVNGPAATPRRLDALLAQAP